MSPPAPEVVVDGLGFPECPRWRDDRLWFSEKRGRCVSRVDETGNAERVVELSDEPGGIGWLPDGCLLIVSQIDRRLLRWDSDGLHEVADLRAVTVGKCNDMVVDDHGRAYVGHFGYDLDSGQPRPSTLVLVSPGGAVSVAADDLDIPNGAEITDDGCTLVVAETGARRLTAFSITTDGALIDRRTWADLGPIAPDGICLDEEGAVWVASPLTREVIRVRQGGKITTRIPVGDLAAFACTLGGRDGRTLFVCVDELAAPMQSSSTGRGQILATRVAVPAA